MQLPLYAMLLENGYTELPANEVAAANFYIVKDRTRRKGYHMKDTGAELYDGVNRQYNFISPGEKQELFHDLAGGINSAVSDIMNGKLNPNPLDKKTCDRCSWRKQCRAPHLN